MTEEICRQKPRHANLIGFEINGAFAKATRLRCPDAEIVNRCATTARTTLSRKQLHFCDSIVSGLPWATFSTPLQNTLLGAAAEALRPGGVFVTFTYLHSLPLASAQRFHNKLRCTFSQVHKSSVIWGNIPPAIVYIAVK